MYRKLLCSRERRRKRASSTWQGDSAPATKISSQRARRPRTKTQRSPGSKGRHSRNRRVVSPNDCTAAALSSLSHSNSREVAQRSEGWYSAGPGYNRISPSQASMGCSPPVKKLKFFDRCQPSLRTSKKTAISRGLPQWGFGQGACRFFARQTPRTKNKALYCYMTKRAKTLWRILLVAVNNLAQDRQRVTL